MSARHLGTGFLFLAVLARPFLALPAGQCPPTLQACGPACYDPAVLSCTGTTLCPLSQQACGTACFDPKAYSCTNGALGPISGGSGGGGGGGDGAQCPPQLKPCGPACYDPSQNSCDGSTLCALGQKACGSACFNPAAYSCTNGVLGPAGGSGGPSGGGSSDVCAAGLQSCKDELGKPTCIDTSKGDYNCWKGVINQGPGLDLSGRPGEIYTGTEALGEGDRSIQIVNLCEFPVWVGFEGTPLPLEGGVGIAAAKQLTVKVSSHLTSARIWGRTGCRYNGDKLVCATGDCGNPANKYSLGCQGQGALKPTTLAEFTFNGFQGTDYYDISNVDGHNIGIMIQAIGGMPAPGVEDQYNCKPVSCAMDLTRCPDELMVRNQDGSISCASISTAVNLPLSRNMYPFVDNIFQNPDSRALVMCDCACGENCGCESPNSKYCCSPYNAPSPKENGGKCRVEQWPTSPFATGSIPKRYDTIFKSQCPGAYSWQFDDQRSLMQCVNANYAVTFCPDPKYNLDAGGASLPRTGTDDAVDPEDLVYLYEDDWDEKYMDGFEPKLDNDHKITSSFDDDLSAFVLKRVDELKLFPITAYRMTLFGYMKAYKLLTDYIVDLFKYDPETSLPVADGGVKALDDKLLNLMFADPGHDMFDCRDDGDDKITCPRTTAPFSVPLTDINWKQVEGTNFKKHVYVNLGYPPQFLTTLKARKIHENRPGDRGGGHDYTWLSTFTVATSSDYSYFGTRALGYYRDTAQKGLPSQLDKFCKSNSNLFRCNGGACNDFTPYSSTKEIAITVPDLDAFYKASPVEKSAISFDGSFYDTYIDEKIMQLCAGEKPNGMPKCPGRPWETRVKYTGYPSIKSDYPDSPQTVASSFITNAPGQRAFLNKVILSHNVSEIMSAINVAAGYVAGGNQIIVYVKTYMDGVDAGHEDAAQKALATNSIFKTIMEMVIGAALACLLPGAGEVIAAGRAIWASARAAVAITDIADTVEGYEGISLIVKEISDFAGEAAAIAGRLYKALPKWQQEALRAAGKAFEKTRGVVGCVALDMGLQEAFGAGLDKVVSGALARRDDNPLDITHIYNRRLERRGVAKPKACILDWDTTDDFRSNDYADACIKNKTPDRPLCTLATPVIDPHDPNNNRYTEVLSSYPAGGKCPSGRALSCDHVLELQEFGNLVGALTVHPNIKKDRFCENFTSGLSEDVFARLNDRKNMRSIDYGANGLKGIMMAGSNPSSPTYVNQEVVGSLHQALEDGRKQRSDTLKELHDMMEARFAGNQAENEVFMDVMRNWKAVTETNVDVAQKILRDFQTSGKLGSMPKQDPRHSYVKRLGTNDVKAGRTRAEAKAAARTASKAQLDASTQACKKGKV
ncbi:hypothetical protein HDU88_003570 [Geranomyces variabilis]|nr:hypothetical protein HDU88_003570 [Geranomyces variabilis]